MTAMKRVTPEALDAIAWEHHRLIEVDEEQGVKVVQVGRTTFYADLVEPERGAS